MSANLTGNLPESALSLKEGDQHRLQFGELLLEISHHRFEWIVRYAWSADIGHWPEDAQQIHTRRYVFEQSVEKIEIMPMLADRAVVSQPLSPITLMPGSQARIYISTPLWLGVCIGDTRVLELPSVQLSDTWFGLKTGAGELCYSDTTRARLEPADTENLYYKAITPILVKNDDDRQMPLDRINVPVTILPLYRQRGEGRYYFTSSITATLQSGDEPTRITLGNSSEHNGQDFIRAARKPQKKQFLTRAIDLFLG